MNKYKVGKFGGVVLSETNTHIPECHGNRFWQEYQKWIAEGNTPDPADPIPEPTTRQRIKARLFSEYDQAEVSLALLEKEAGDPTKFNTIKARAIEIKAEETA